LKEFLVDNMDDCLSCLYNILYRVDRDDDQDKGCGIVFFVSNNFYGAASLQKLHGCVAIQKMLDSILITTVSKVLLTLGYV